MTAVGCCHLLFATLPSAVSIPPSGPGQAATAVPLALRAMLATVGDHDGPEAPVPEMVESRTGPGPNETTLLSLRRAVGPCDERAMAVGGAKTRPVEQAVTAITAATDLATESLCEVVVFLASMSVDRCERQRPGSDE
jgi:hypothetical protein